MSIRDSRLGPRSTVQQCFVVVLLAYVRFDSASYVVKGHRVLQLIEIFYAFRDLRQTSNSARSNGVNTRHHTFFRL
jgi:hypothetical protein